MTPAELGARASAALARGEEEAVLPEIKSAAVRLNHAELWQWAGLLARALDDHAEAIEAFDKAAALAPRTVSIAYGRAQVALEAGIPSIDLFEAALRLDPARGDIRLGYCSALLAASRGAEAERLLVDALRKQPGWVAGHRGLAQLRGLIGNGESAFVELEAAIGRAPGDATLLGALLDGYRSAERYRALGDAAARARKAGMPRAIWQEAAAIAAAETLSADAAKLLAELPSDQLPVWRARHALRTGDMDQARKLIDRTIGGPDGLSTLPYAATLWRMTADPRWRWLMRDGQLVRAMDITDRLPPIDTLAARLRELHRAKGTFLDQSVRGGTQTDGPLFSRIDPVIKAARKAIVDAVERYLAALPPVDREHPFLCHPRDRRVRFSGSWSVRLAGGGHHANHVHPLGWISSALYIVLPERAADSGPTDGWLVTGVPPADLGMDVPSERAIEPKVGRLVLFPSWLWHGTVPFQAGERMTIAFDVAPPL